MRLGSVFILFLSAGLGLTAAFLASNWLDQQRARPQSVATSQETKNTAHIVVAGQPLRFGTELTSLNLAEVEWPGGALPQGAFSSISELTKEGERRVVLTAIERNEPILAAKITGPGQRASLSSIIDGTKTAMTIRVNDVSGTAGFVLPGEWVDVLMTRTEDKSAYADVLLQNIRTLAVDQLADERAEKPSVARAVTLEVTTAQAQKLALAEVVGQLSLALRPAGITTVSNTQRINVSDLGTPEPVQAARQMVELPAAAVQVPPPPPLAVVGITRVLKREEYRVRPERMMFSSVPVSRE